MSNTVTLNSINSIIKKYINQLPHDMLVDISKVYNRHQGSKESNPLIIDNNYVVNKGWLNISTYVDHKLTKHIISFNTVTGEVEQLVDHKRINSYVSNFIIIDNDTDKILVEWSDKKNPT